MFQFNDNQVEDWADLEQLTDMKNLETVYLERNPIWRDKENQAKIDPNYRRKVMLQIPWIKQIDASYCR